MIIIFSMTVNAPKGPWHAPASRALLPDSESWDECFYSGALREANQIRALTLNISGPSLERAGRIISFLAEVNPDVLVLTETRPTPGTAHVLQSFRSSGYDVQMLIPSTSGERGVAVVHRLSNTEQIPRPSIQLNHRLVAIRLCLDVPVILVGMYVPSRDSSPQKITRKKTFLSETHRFLNSLDRSEHMLLMGDFNVVHRTHVPRYTSFRAWEYDFLDDLSQLNLVDTFCELHPGVQAHSWIGRKGAGYRYDYAFLSRSLQERVDECAYISQCREQGVTDHAGLLVTLKSRAILRDVNVDPLGWSTAATAGSRAR